MHARLAHRETATFAGMGGVCVHVPLLIDSHVTGSPGVAVSATALPTRATNKLAAMHTCMVGTTLWYNVPLANAHGWLTQAAGVASLC